MKIKIALILVLVSSFAVLAAEKKTASKETVEEEKAPKVKVPDNDEEILCHKEQVRAHESIEASIETCVTQVKDKAKTSKKQAPNPNDCIAKCVLDSEISLVDGLLTPANLKKAVKQRISGVFQDGILKKLNDCNDKFGKHVLPADEFCGGYEKLANCMTAAFGKICITEKPTKAKDEL